MSHRSLRKSHLPSTFGLVFGNRTPPLDLAK
jgi:hypothetical protein